MPGLMEASGLFFQGDSEEAFRIDAHERFFDINISPVFKFYFMIMPESGAVSFNHKMKLLRGCVHRLEETTKCVSINPNKSGDAGS
jgi:hypothetical protein